MNEFTVESDTRELDYILQNLGNKNTVSDIINEGLKEASTVYLQSVISSIRKEMGSAATRSPRRSKYKTPIYLGIGQKLSPENNWAGVHAIGDFRLKFFEGGTTPKKIKSRGIAANHFFTKGIESANDSAMKTLQETIIKSIRNRGIEIS